MPSTTFLLAYSAQLAVVAGVTALVLAAAARRLPALRLVTWRGVIVLAWLLPVTALLPERESTPPTPALAAVNDARTPTDLPMAAGAVLGPDRGRWVGLALVCGVAARFAWIAGAVLLVGRRLRSSPTSVMPLFEEQRTRHGIDARLVYRDDVTHPFTFGDNPAMVVLPAWTRDADVEVLRAIVTHELVHAARRDWRWLVLEECALAALWFHPAGWLARVELRLAREEIVDRETVTRLGSRRRYLEVLMALADRRPAPVALAVPVFHARQLPRRVTALISEVPMSRTRSAVTVLSVLASASTSVAAASHALPLPALAWFAPSTQPAAAPGPLEQQAYVAPRDAAAPARLTYVAPVLPRDVAVTGDIDVELRLVLDGAGTVAEARATAVSGGVPADASGAVATAVVAAARKWRFAAPAAAPLALTTTITLEPSPSAGVPALATRERPAPVQLIAATYPEDDQSAGMEGVAEVEVTIDASGRVSNTRIVKATTPAMGEAAVKALRQSTFRPGMRDGTPVPVTVTIAIRFALK